MNSVKFVFYSFYSSFSWFINKLKHFCICELPIECTSRVLLISFLNVPTWLSLWCWNIIDSIFRPVNKLTFSRCVFLLYRVWLRWTTLITTSVWYCTEVLLKSRILPYDIFILNWIWILFCYSKTSLFRFCIGIL